MTADDERERLDREWQELIAHYGDRAELPPDDPTTQSAGPAAPAEPSVPDHEPIETEPPSAESAASEPAEVWRGSTGPTFDQIDSRFVPPDPPIPLPSPDRLAAWVGVIGMPIVAFVLAIAQVWVPSIVLTAMVLWFLGGFGYLVWQLPDHRNRYDGDDGAQV